MNLRRPGAKALLAATSLSLLMAGLVPTAAQAEETPNQIINGSFDSGGAGWVGYPNPSYDGGRACNAVPAGTGGYAAAIRQDNLPVVAGETYALSFTAWSPTAADGASVPYVRAVIQGGAEVNYAAAFPSTKLALTNVPTSLSYTFTVPADANFPNNTTLEFSQDIGNDVDYTFCIDDVSLLGGAEPEIYEPDTGPRVRVNQVGYLPKGPKSATLVTDATDPVAWQLKNSGGSVVASGNSTPKGVDPTADLNVHVIDFSSVTATGSGFTLEADGETSYPFAISSDVYKDLRADAMTFFYTNRSGIAIDDALAPGYGRAAGHVGVAPNLGDTAVPCQSLDDDSQKILVKQGDQPWTCDYTQDVSGGWYDAGDHGKYVVNGGIAVAQLLSTFERTKTAGTVDVGALKDGSLSIPESSNGVPDTLDEARWELEWLLKMQVKPGKQLAGMAFHKVADVDWTGLPLDPAADPQKRVLYRPSTAATLNLAAVAAQGARLFAPYDPAFAKKLLAASKTAYAAAKANPALFAPSADGALDPNPGSGPYDDKNVSDEFYWAAAELFITTAEKAYRDDVVGSALNTSASLFGPNGFGWADVAALGRLDLATVPNAIPGRAAIKASVVAAADAYLADQAAQPFGQAYNPPDANYTWGSNSSILNNQVVIATAFDLTGTAKYRDGVLRSMDYLLGRNALNLSYITGYGTVFSQNQHSRLYSHELDPSSPNPPAGTVAGGPNSTTLSTGDPVTGQLFSQGCVGQFCYVDKIGSWSTNEITVNWNAPMAWVASFVADVGAQKPATSKCSVTYDKNAEWTNAGIGMAFITNVVVKNTGTTPINDWALSFAFPGAQAVSSSWSADFSQSGATVTAKAPSYGRNLAPGSSATIGFIGSTMWANPAPELFRVNGAVCS